MLPGTGSALDRDTRVTTPKAQGFALIDLIFVCGIIGVLCSISLPKLLLAKQAAGAASALSSLRAINSAELTYALTCGNGFYAPNLTTLGIAPPGSREPFITGGLGASDTVAKSGYVIQLAVVPYAGAPGSCNGVAAGDGGQGYKAAADPSEPTNKRFFATNSNAAVYEDSASLFSAMPEIGQPAAGRVLR